MRRIRNFFRRPKKAPEPHTLLPKGWGALDERINSLIEESEDLRVRIAEKSAKRPQDL